MNQRLAARALPAGKGKALSLDRVAPTQANVIAGQ